MNELPRQGFGGRRTYVIVAAIILLIVAASIFSFRRGNKASPLAAERLLREARVALSLGKYDEAERLALKIDGTHALSGRARLIAGEAAARSGRFDSAAEYYTAVPRDGSKTAAVASLASGEVFRTVGRLSDAEREYEYVIEHQPANVAARRRLVFLLSITGRQWEAATHVLFLAKSGSADWNDLFLLGEPERPVQQVEYLRQCARNSPNDILVRLGLAVSAVNEERLGDAKPMLEGIVARAPQLVAAQALLGEMIVEADDETFQRWHRALPPAADASPEVWFVRGLRARSRGRLRVAARCFWETVKLAPTHLRGTYQLGQVLTALGETSGDDFPERSDKLFQLTKALNRVQESEGHDEAAVQSVTELMEDLGRLWESRAWAIWAASAFPRAAWPVPTIDRLSPLLADDTPQTIASANPARRFDLRGFPDGSALFNGAGTAASPRAVVPRAASIKFEEAFDAGIDFIYANGNDPLDETALRELPRASQGDRRARVRMRNRTRLFEQNGGGVAVLDFDGDGWPDLFFNQGCEWKHGAPGPSSPGQVTDRLYRNVAGQSFADVTAQSRLIDRGYGQGCAAGDFDNDGFPDLYVANIGRNRLHRNNGDGTFSDVTESWNRQEDTWTASCVIVDLNADGIPDLFDVTYVAGEGVYDAVCGQTGCSPNQFQGIPDRLSLNRGDGAFEFVPNATPDSDSSKGLGVVAVELFERRRPCLFVGNDQVPNFLLRNLPSSDGRNVRLQDEAFACGLAFNGEGRAVASMGIAADDANGDGRIDFFVTDFKDEPRVLYLQDAAGTFVDATRAADLRSAGLPFVGWGTQFLDADRDGEPDLVAVNGHVDDFRDEGEDYQMRPQFFRNTGGGHFVELKSPEVGPWFGQKYLGRGLARLDWNRDGRMDFVVSNIGARASLMTNVSTGTAHFLNLRVHARESARDAIGTVIEVDAGGRHWVKQLLAGDGYMASNERMVQFGIGDADVVRQLRISWPSGDDLSISDVPVDVTLELVEGRRAGVCWRGSQPEAFEVDHSRCDFAARRAAVWSACAASPSNPAARSAIANCR